MKKNCLLKRRIQCDFYVISLENEELNLPEFNSLGDEYNCAGPAVLSDECAYVV